MLERTLETTLRRALQTFPAVVLSGARQTGKTTLLRGALPTHRYVSVENPDVRARASADPVGFLREHPPPVVIDEIQQTPSLLPFIKTRIDEDRSPGQWVLSGSQVFPLMAGVTESLAGRAAVLTLLPLSLGEAAGRPRGASSVDAILANIFREADGRAPAAAPGAPPLADWVLRGGFPEPRAHLEVDRRLWCSSYIQTYLERDVRALAAVGDLGSFNRFLRLAAARTAQLLNLSDLARDTGVSQPTARRWLSVLEASGQIHLLPPLHGNYAKRLVKSPKLYFVDTALATFLVGLHDAEPAMRGPLAGALVETAIVAEWLKVFRHRGEPSAMSFFRTADGLEVDLVIERNGELFAAEVKATATVLPAHATALRRFRDLTGAAAPSVVFADIAGEHALVPGVVARPWSALG
ncbi:MAG: ATP-binding protein [Polyangiaceae bacterium]|nr:ATP-binding protein [Polyangiaceae bacterium]